MTTPLVSQLSLHLRDPRWRPVMNTNGAMAALDISAMEVDELLDLGHISGFNIAVDSAGRRELRILTRSIEHYRSTLGSRALDLSWSHILRLVLPHRKPVISGLEIQRSINCDCYHVTRLIVVGQISVVPGTSWQRGPGGSPSVLTASFEQFLKKRLL